MPLEPKPALATFVVHLLFARQIKLYTSQGADCMKNLLIGNSLYHTFLMASVVMIRVQEF